MSLTTRHAVSRTLAGFGLLAASSMLLAAPLIGSANLCSNCPQRIPDAGAIANTPAFANAQIPVGAGACGGGAAVGGIEVFVDVLHARAGDLRLRLRDPQGTFYVLTDRLPRSGGAAGSCSGDDVSLVYLDSAASAAPACGEQIPGVSGSVRASASLAAFTGAPIAAGTWTLEAGDYADNGDGSIRNARLQFYCTSQLSFFRDGLED